MSLTTWTNEQLLSLAQDHLLVGAAESVANPSKWRVLGYDDRGIWGEFDNKDKPPFHTLAARPNMVISCNCPSRKYPCRHALGLSILVTNTPTIFKAASPPAWVQTLYDNKDDAADQSAAAVLAQQRAGYQRQLAKAQNGMHNYALWLQDMVHTGLASLPQKPAKFWVTMANRLADNGSFKLAQEVRQLQAVLRSPPKVKVISRQRSLFSPRPAKKPLKIPADSSWPKPFLQRIGRHYLITQGFSNYEHLSRDQRADLRYAAGWFNDPDDAWPESENDYWLVTGSRLEMRQGKNIQQAWLWGQVSKRFALVSQQYPRTDMAFQPLFLGATVQGTLAFYPGSWRSRAKLASLQQITRDPVNILPSSSLKAASSEYGRALSANPWLDAYPVALGKISILLEEGRWFLRDQEGYRWPLVRNFMFGWHLAALLPLDGAIVFGEWNGRFFNPLSIRERRRWLPLTILKGIK